MTAEGRVIRTSTGNTRTTPHLLFGIYDRGAINPLPFINFPNDRIEPIIVDPQGFPKWHQIMLPHGQKGFLCHSLVEPADTPLYSISTTKRYSVFETVKDNRPFFVTDSSVTIQGYGTFQNRQLIRYRNHWVWTGLNN